MDVLTDLIAIIISQHIHGENHHPVHLKLYQLYLSKAGTRKPTKGKPR